MRHENQLTSKFIQSLDGESPRRTAKFYWMHSFECSIQYNWQLEIDKSGNKALVAIENRSNSWIRRNFSNNWRHVINKPLLTETYALSVSLGGYMFKTDSRLRDGLNPSEFAVFNLLLDTKVKWTTRSPPFFLTDSRPRETRARVKINPREKGETRRWERKITFLPIRLIKMTAHGYSRMRRTENNGRNRLRTDRPFQAFRRCKEK